MTLNSDYICGKNCRFLFDNSLVFSEKEYLDKMNYFSENSLEKASISIASGNIDDPKLRFSKHNFIHMLFVDSGCIKINIKNAESFTLKRGDICLINFGSDFEIEFIETELNLFMYTMKKSFFDNSMLGHLADYDSLYKFFQYCLLEYSDMNTHLVFKTNHFTINQILYILINSIYDYDENLLQITFKYLMDYLSQSKFAEFDIYRSSDLKTSLIDSILKYINENNDSVTLKELGNYFNYHPNYISSLVREKTKTTFSEHVTNSRMIKAAAMLRDTDEKIIEIAHKVGYGESSSFYRVFRKVYNCSPSEYRDKFNN